ncbi:MAG: hypothetical protein JWN94_1298 [Betaproteobacteria bacterium]|nr:hypothetical protein [Betaproteobacteria bacterium]
MPENLLKRALHARRQLGQAATEYTIVTFFAVVVLIVPDENGDVAIVKLANALKTFYNGFAYAISFSTTITPF